MVYKPVIDNRQVKGWALIRCLFLIIIYHGSCPVSVNVIGHKIVYCVVENLLQNAYVRYRTDYLRMLSLNSLQVVNMGY